MALATWSWLMQELEYAFGQAGGLERFRVALGDERRLRRHLQDHAVARQQRRNHRVHGSQPWVIPGGDDQHHAERLTPDEALETLLGIDLQFGERAFACEHM